MIMMPYRSPRSSPQLTGLGRLLAPHRPAGGLEEVQPLVLAVPALGQAKGDQAAAVAGGTGGDGDEVAADGGLAGPGVTAAGESAGGAQQVVRDGGDGEPGGAGGALPRRSLN
jgi:hypothetical protein